MNFKKYLPKFEREYEKYARSFDNFDDYVYDSNEQDGPAFIWEEIAGDYPPDDESGEELEELMIPIIKKIELKIFGEIFEDYKKNNKENKMKRNFNETSGIDWLNDPTKNKWKKDYKNYRKVDDRGWVTGRNSLGEKTKTKTLEDGIEIVVTEKSTKGRFISVEVFDNNSKVYKENFRGNEAFGNLNRFLEDFFNVELDSVTYNESKKKENIIEIQEETVIEQGNQKITLEKGDKIEVLKEAYIELNSNPFDLSYTGGKAFANMLLNTVSDSNPEFMDGFFEELEPYM